MARTQKNKATAGHLGLLKARLAKLRRELITPKGGGGASVEGRSGIDSAVVAGLTSSISTSIQVSKLQKLEMPELAL